MRNAAAAVICAAAVASCSRQPAIRDIYEQLERVALLEKNFEQEQQPMKELELEEAALYESLFGLGVRDVDKRVEIGRLTENKLYEQERHLVNERMSLEDAEKSFEKVTHMVRKLKDEELREKGDALIYAMEERYEVHKKLYEKCSEALKKEKELYRLFQSDAISFSQIQKQIQDINREYEEVSRLNDLFNELTGDYNARKRAFYKEAGLKIKMVKK